MRHQFFLFLKGIAILLFVLFIVGTDENRTDVQQKEKMKHYEKFHGAVVLQHNFHETELMRNTDEGQRENW